MKNHKDWREKRAVAAVRLRNVIVGRIFRTSKNRIDVRKIRIGPSPLATITIAKCKVKGRRVCTFRRIVVHKGKWI